MGAAPDMVNYQGKVLTEGMRSYLFGHDPKIQFPGESENPAQVSPTRAQEILRNWLFGPPVKPLDPTLAFSQASALSGVKTQAGMGMGMSGAFGFGLPKLPSLDLGPMARGVPYSVPPLPTLGPK